MPSLSSQPNTTPLSVPKKPAAFTDPLTRPEIAAAIPPKEISVTSPQQTNTTNPISQKNEPLIPPLQKKPAAMTANTAKISDLPALEKPRRQLPDDIKGIMETSSRNFAAYAKNVEKTEPIMDEWDRAILFGEYSPRQIARQKIQKILSLPSSSPIPKKIDTYVTGAAFPGRVVDSDASSLLSTRNSVIPKTPAVVPQKPKNKEVEPKNTLTAPLGNVPLKPKQAGQLPANNVLTPPSMSDKLTEKIIEGQMRSVFENAPPLIQKSFEKMTVKDILENTLSGGNIENDVWRKRIREYIEKLRIQARPVFPDANAAEPRDGELLLEYIGRIYPSILKAELQQQEKRYST